VANNFSHFSLATWPISISPILWLENDTDLRLHLSLDPSDRQNQLLTTDDVLISSYILRHSLIKKYAMMMVSSIRLVWWFSIKLASVFSLNGNIVRRRWMVMVIFARPPTLIFLLVQFLHNSICQKAEWKERKFSSTTKENLQTTFEISSSRKSGEASFSTLAAMRYANERN
jgi:hypothetical protein